MWLYCSSNPLKGRKNRKIDFKDGIMIKILKVWLHDLTWEVLGVYLPIATVVVFAMLAVAYWPDYALKTIAVYIPLAMIFSIYISKKFKSK